MNNYRLSFYYFIALLIGIFLALGLLAVRYDYRLDMTFNQQNALHPSSEKIVKQLTGPLTVTAFTRGNPKVKKLIERLLDKYRQHVDINLTFKNPDTAVDLVKQYDITRDGELIIDYQSRQAHVADLSETSITRAIYRAFAETEKTVLFVTGHGERALGNALFDYGALVEKLQAKDFQVGTVDLNLGQNLPEKTDIVVIADAQNAYTEHETQVIVNYLQRGGRLLWLADPDSHPLPTLVAQLGIRALPQFIINRLAKKYRLNQPDYVVIEPQTDEHLLASINTMLLFPQAAPLQILPTQAGDNWKYLPFLSLQGETFLRQKDTIKKADSTVNLAILLTSPHVEQQQKVMVIGDADFLSNQFIGFGQNADFAQNLFTYLAATDDNFIAWQDEMPPAVIMTQKQMGYLALALIIILPTVIFLLGLWLRARLRRNA